MAGTFRSIPPIETSFRKFSQTSNGDTSGESHSPGRFRSLNPRSPQITPTKLPSFPGNDVPKCTLCLLSTSVFVCPCAQPPKALCSACFQLHFTFPAAEGHHQIPISSYDLISPEDQRQSFITYIRRLTSLKSSLLANLDAVSAFEQQLMTELDKLIADLTAAKQTYRTQLEKVRGEISMEIDFAVRQIEEVVYSPAFQPLSAFEVQVLGCWTRDPDLRSTQLFTSEVDFSEVRQQLQRLAYFHTQFDYFRSEEAAPNVLVGVSYSSLRMYNLSEKRESRKNLRQSFTQGTVYCFIEHDMALCVGGVPPTNSVFKLQLPAATLSPGPPLSVARGFSGIRKHGDYVYVFGGNWPSTSSCEKLSLVDWTWHELPRMSVPRYAFNPCYYKGELLLADPQNSSAVEAFSLAMETFRILPVTLPEMSGNSVAFIANKQWRIASSYGQLAVLNLARKGEMFTLQEVKNTPIISSWPPVVVGNVVYFINYSSGDLRRYMVDTGLFL